MKKILIYVLYHKKLLLRMKLTTIMLCFCILQVSASTKSIGQNLSLHVKDKTIRESLKEIENRSNFRFFFNDAFSDLDKVVTIDADNKTIREVLGELLSSSKVTYRVLENNLVVIAPVTELQQQTVTGKVTDANTGEPLPSVSILIEGTTQGTLTDLDGKFTITVPNANAVLVFSYIGYISERRAVGNSATINMNLIPDIKDLDAVVVVGYGAVRKSDLTSAISNVTSRDIMKTPVTSAEQALQGNASGVIVITSDGAPGSDVSIRVRGSSSILGDNEPLIVVDGFTSDQGLSSINPGDIQGIEVLKDASATAIYGSRGANGVVMITTKSGQAGKPKVSYQGYYGVQQLRHKLDMLNAPELAILLNDANRTIGKTPANWSTDTLSNGIDWQDAIFRNAAQQSHSLTISGGDKRLKYYVSGTYLDQDGIVANSNFQRITLHPRLDLNLTDKLQIGINLNLAQTNKKVVVGGDNGAILRSLLASPSQTNYLDASSGFYVDENGEIVGTSPISTAYLTYDHRKNQTFQGNVYMNWDILKSLTFRSSATISTGNEQDYYYFPNTLAGVSKVSVAQSTSNQQYKWLNDNTLTFKTKLKEHSITLMVGQSAEYGFKNSFEADGQNYNTDVFLVYNLGAGSGTPTVKSSASDFGSLVSLFGRAMYNYSDKYLLTLTFRTDGSSKFGPNNRWGYFPSGSFAWRLSNEPLIKNLNIFYDWKIRLGYGLTGSDRIPAYSSEQQYKTYYSAIGGSQSVGYGINTLGNPNLKWETTEQYNVGTDISFFSGRLSGSFDVYYKNTYDLLLNYRLPSASGYTTVVKNIGTVENKGLEFNLSSQNIAGPKFQWTTSVNFGINKSKVTDLGGVDQIPMVSNASTSNWSVGNVVLLKVGQPLNAFWGYTTDGLFADWAEVNATPAKLEGSNTKPGFIKYIDRNGDNQITDDDKVILGYGDPKWQAGLTNTFTYKNLDLTVFFIGQFGNSILNANKAKFINVNGAGNDYAVVLNRWREPNPETGDPGNQSKWAPYPRANANSYTAALSEVYIENGSYLRLKTVTLGYNLPKKFINHLKISGVKIYATGTNLLTFTKYSGFDPEISTSGNVNIGTGIDNGGYPQSRMYLFGLNVEF